VAAEADAEGEGATEFEEVEEEEEDERRLKMGLAPGLSALRTALKKEPSGAEANDGAASAAAAAASTEAGVAPRCASDEGKRADDGTFEKVVDDAKAAETTPDKEGGGHVTEVPSAADAD
jgi:hypothetical protein